MCLYLHSSSAGSRSEAVAYTQAPLIGRTARIVEAASTKATCTVHIRVPRGFVSQRSGT
jgi:hypothetical protein